MAEDAVGVGEYAGFDLAEMSDDFGSGPGVWRGSSLPAVGRDGVRDGQKTGLGGGEFGADGVEVGHVVFTQ